MATFGNMVVLEARLEAADLKSGKPISNILYCRNVDNGTGYGSTLTGSNLTTAAASIRGIWVNNVIPLLSENYQLSRTLVRTIVGRRWMQPMIPIVGVAPTLTDTQIITSSPHRLSVGNSVYIQGVPSPITTNGLWTVTRVVTANEFAINTIVGFSSPGGGTMQWAAGAQEFAYGDQAEYNGTDLGAVSGDAYPLYVTVSFRRPNPGIGRNWRSRVSVSIIPESAGVDGRLTSVALTAWELAGTGMDNSMGGGGAITVFNGSVSKNLAFSGPLVFTESNSWFKFNTDWIPQPNFGSLTRRKPRLTSPIA